MTQEALVFMLVVWAIVLGNTLYCFWKMLTSEKPLSPEEEHVREDFRTA